jgi:malate dehydrogenase (oxaloacetate-decarboxylating)(NADP+)
VAKAAMESGVAREPITDWDRYGSELLVRSGDEKKVMRMLMNRAKGNPKQIVFSEADQLNVLKTAQIAYEEGIAHPILLGNRVLIEGLMRELEFDAEIPIIDLYGPESLDKRQHYAQRYWQGRSRKGTTLYGANIKMRQRNYFGAMMVLEGDADGMISGYTRAYPTVVKPIFEVIGRSADVARAATVHIMITPKGPYFLADTSIIIDPTAEELAAIARMTANLAVAFGFEPVLALLSYTNFGSSDHPNARKVAKAVQILHEQYPELQVDGEIQADFALNRGMNQDTFPFSRLVGRKVNTLIFPNLESANITYKLLKELYGADTIGPIMLGLRKAVHVVPMGASVEEMVNMTAVAVIDVQEREKRKQARISDT